MGAEGPRPTCLVRQNIILDFNRIFVKNSNATIEPCPPNQ